jgi:hypothetical protein
MYIFPVHSLLPNPTRLSSSSLVIMSSTQFSFANLHPALLTYRPLYFTQSASHTTLTRDRHRDPTTIGFIVRACEDNALLDPWDKDRVLMAVLWCSPNIYNKFGMLMVLLAGEEESVRAMWLRKFASACLGAAGEYKYGMEEFDGTGGEYKYGMEEFDEAFCDHDREMMNWAVRKMGGLRHRGSCQVYECICDPYQTYTISK